MLLASTNVGFGGKADITVDGPECLLLTDFVEKVGCCDE
jgi:hypothetical protein